MIRRLHARFASFVIPPVAQSASRTLFRRLLVVALLLFQSLPIAGQWWDSECAQGGQCDTMQRAYADLVQGEACGAIYVTGLCSGLCMRSLRATIGRRLWARCAEHCDWSAGVVSAADSWLRWCVSRPAEDAKAPEVLDIEIRHGEKLPESEYETNTAANDRVSRSGIAGQEGRVGGDSAEMGRSKLGPASVRIKSLKLAVTERYNRVIGWLCTRQARLLALVVILLVFLPLAARRARSGSGSSYKRAPGGIGGLLGTSTRSENQSLLRHELQALQRGARRHLKGARHYLD
jgi:hypothetical protein